MNSEDLDAVHQRFLAPMVVGMTALVWGEALLEVLTRGGLRPQDALADLYLTLMGGYVAGIEAQKWTQKDPADPADDPWLERVNRAGWLLLLWWGLYLVVHLWRYQDPLIPMPASLKPVTMGMILLFIGKRVSRHVRHTQRGVGGVGGDAGTEEDSISDAQVLGAVTGSAEGLTLQEIEAALPDVSRASIKRSLHNLLAAGRLARRGTPRSRDARYRLPS